MEYAVMFVYCDVHYKKPFKSFDNVIYRLLASFYRDIAMILYNKRRPKTNLFILWNLMTLTSFVFTELANTIKYGGGFLYNLIFTEWRHCVSQN